MSRKIPQFFDISIGKKLFLSYGIHPISNMNKV